MSRRSRLIIILVGLITLSSVATAFVLLSPHRRWFNLPRNVIVDNTGMPGVDDGDNGISAVQGAVEMWDNPSGADVIDILSTTTGPPNVVLGDGISHLVFEDPFHVCTGSCLAANFTGFYTTSQTLDCNGDTLASITDSDTVFNTLHDWTSEGETSCSGEFYIEAVAGHEIGHLIGIGHSQNGSALMAPSISSCFNKPLHQDDIDARDALYNCGPCQSTCGNGSIECDEVCDGDVSCSSAGNFTEVGFASCINNCGFLDTSGCIACSSDELGMCGDNVDNDCDGLTDSSDPDCCVATENPELSCTDGQDNDCDGDIDTADADCQLCGDTGSACTSNSNCCSNKCRGKTGEKTCKGDFTCAASETSCTDLSDNDCDGDTDCSDSECLGDPACGGACADTNESCRNDSDCCSLSCSKGNPSNRVCLP